MKEGYKEEFKYFCLALSLVVIFASPNLVSLIVGALPLGDSQLAPIACYAAFLAFVYAFGITLDAIVPYPVKEWLLYPSVKGRGILRPGCKVFSKLGSGKLRDSRFRIEDARVRYSDQIEYCGQMSAEESADYQNSCWYQLYRSHCNLASVKSNNIGYMYSRDVSVLSFSIFALSLVVDIVSWFLVDGFTIGAFSIAFSFAVAVVCSFSARAKANRLVATVIACDLASDRK